MLKLEVSTLRCSSLIRLKPKTNSPPPWATKPLMSLTSSHSHLSAPRPNTQRNSGPPMTKTCWPLRSFAVSGFSLHTVSLPHFLSCSLNSLKSSNQVHSLCDSSTRICTLNCRDGGLIRFRSFLTLFCLASAIFFCLFYTAFCCFVL